MSSSKVATEVRARPVRVGGAVSKIQILSATPDAGTVPVGGISDEIAVLGGIGGDSTTTGSGGKTGAGGAITTVDVENVNLAGGSSVLVQGGDGGNALGAAVGSGGGTLTGITLLSTDITVQAGNGSGREDRRRGRKTKHRDHRTGGANFCGTRRDQCRLWWEWRGR